MSRYGGAIWKNTRMAKSSVYLEFITYLILLTKLLNGYIVNKAAEANEYGVNERSIQRDVDDIRNYLELEAVNSVYNYLILLTLLSYYTIIVRGQNNDFKE